MLCRRIYHIRKWPKSALKILIHLLFWLSTTVCLLLTITLTSQHAEDYNHKVYKEIASSGKDKETSALVNTDNTKLSWLRPRRLISEINCRALMGLDPQSSYDAHNNSLPVPQESSKWSVMSTDADVISATADCRAFLSHRSSQHQRTSTPYINSTLSAEERAFPLAYTILVHKDAAQVERLFRALHHPQNLYCFHIDQKSSSQFYAAIASLTRCFPNAFITSKLERVQWSKPSQVLANMACMEDLNNYHTHRWKYLLNIAGQEFPIRTNRELVQILKIYHPKNYIVNDKFGASLRKVVRDRTKYTMGGAEGHHSGRSPPPHNLSIYKGLSYGAFSRQFVRYLVRSEVSRAYWAWLRNGSFTDELYWNTLNANPGPSVPGGWRPSHTTVALSSIRAVIWKQHGGVPCHSKVYVRSVCILGVGDLRWLSRQPALVANKFYGLSSDRGLARALDCVEEWLWNRTATQHHTSSHLDTLNMTFYRAVRRDMDNGS